MGNIKQKFLQGERIFSEGDPGDGTFRVLAGEVLISKENSRGEPVPIETLGPGELLGEMYLLSQTGLRSATATAATDVLLEVIPRDEMLLSLGSLSPGVRNILLDLTHRLDKTSQQVAEHLRKEGEPTPLSVPDQESLKRDLSA